MPTPVTAEDVLREIAAYKGDNINVVRVMAKQFVARLPA